MDINVVIIYSDLCAIIPFVNVFEKVLGRTDGSANLDVDVGSVFFEQVFIVRHHKLIANALYFDSPVSSPVLRVLVA